MGTDIYLFEVQTFKPKKIEIGQSYDLFDEGFLEMEDLSGTAEQIKGFRELFRPYIGFWEVPVYNYNRVADPNKYIPFMSGPEGVEFVLKSFERFIDQGKTDLIPPQAFQKFPWDSIPQEIVSTEGIIVKEISYQRKGLTHHWYRAYYNHKDMDLSRNLFYRLEDLRKFYYCSPLKLREQLPTCIDFPKQWNDGKTFVYVSG